jgi:hypothetical protein
LEEVAGAHVMGMLTRKRIERLRRTGKRDDSTRPVIAGTGRVVAFDMEYTGTGSEPRQVFVHENAKLRGDFTGDGNIDVFDSLMLLANWCEDTDCCTCCAYDLNGDGQVDDDDLDILLDNWG